MIKSSDNDKKARRLLLREVLSSLILPFAGGTVIGVLCLSFSGLGILTIMGLGVGIGILCTILALFFGGI